MHMLKSFFVFVLLLLLLLFFDQTNHPQYMDKLYFEPNDPRYCCD